MCDYIEFVSAYVSAFDSLSSNKRQGTYVEHQNDRANGPAQRPDSLQSGLSVIALWIVHACSESVKVPDFLWDLLVKPVGLTQEPTCNGSRPPLYIDEWQRPIEPPTNRSINQYTSNSLHFAV
jgi:hypothetical protein